MVSSSNSKWHFQNHDSDFHFEMQLDGDTKTYYFPICNERLHASITPRLAGDSCIDINSYLLKPITEEGLMDTAHSRNFWVITEDSVWSATGNSIMQKMENEEVVTVRGGLLYHEVVRENKKIGLKSTILNFVPATDDAIELMRVSIENISNEIQNLSAVVAIPVYGRSADNIRDHNHVTSLLHRVRVLEPGVLVEPTLSFDERGHVKNHLKYQVYAIDQDEQLPNEIVPIMEDFIGSGTLDWPDYVVLRKKIKCQENDIQGRYPIGALKFDTKTIKPGESVTYYVLMGIDNNQIDYNQFLIPNKFKELFTQTKQYWRAKISTVDMSTNNPHFDNWMRWVKLQPVLRRIYGNSYLPHHDYGRGGRGWRDLWQDILSLILIENQEVRELLISNFAGVRMDGSNATIIGSNPGEFKADRNNIPRVWMDHGVWPLYALHFYLNQTGDLDILLEEQSYFNDQFSFRCRKTNPYFQYSLGTRLKTSDGKVHFASILEHLLIQNLTSALNVGMNNNILLEGGDWNDALDMARDFGESVAFTAFYASNLGVLSDLLLKLKETKGIVTISLTQELTTLLSSEIDLSNPNEKQSILQEYFSLVDHEVSGEFRDIEIDYLAEFLRKISNHIIDHLNSNEIIEGQNKYRWFNGYYDNFGDRVEGYHETGVRMTLTGQALPLLTGIIKSENIPDIIESVDRFLFDKEIGGLRLNTNFNEVKLNLGRAFGFAYGHKENGAMFSHMAIIYAYGLYLNNFPHKGYKIINSLYTHLMNSDKSQIYPNLPEYINQQGRGMYSYLTGSASWLIYLMVTQVYGVKGDFGDLIIEPKLLKEQFKSGKAELHSTFRNFELNLIFYNREDKDYGDYRITSYMINEKETSLKKNSSSLKLTYKELQTFAMDGSLNIVINLT